MEQNISAGIDFNASENDGAVNDLIPDNTIAQVRMEIQPGGVGPDGMLTRSQSSDVIMLRTEVTVTSGEYSGSSFRQDIMLDGGKRDKDGRSKCGIRGHRTIRAILESARNIHPGDTSEAAMAGRRINGWQDLNNLSFWAVIGIDKDKNGNYPDKNVLTRILTPGMNGYGGVEASSTDASTIS